MSNIELWGWDKKPRTMLRYVKVGDIVCFEIDRSGNKFGYGQLIARLTGGFVFKGLNITHDHADSITVEELQKAESLGSMYLLDVYGTLDNKKYLHDGDWRIIGHEKDFRLSEKDINTVFFEYGANGVKKKVSLLNEHTPITDKEAENCIPATPVSGDQAKVWYL